MNSLRLEYENWLRVAILTDFGGRELCYDVLFNKEQLPTDGKLLWKELDGLKFQYKDQREIVCPSSGSTDYTKFDVTLYTSIIQKKFGKSYDPLVTDLRKARNGLFHRGKKEISNNEFECLWKDISDMLQKHGFDLQLIADLKVCDIFSHDPFKEIANFICQEEMKEEIRGLKEGVYGIRADTADIKELKKSVHDIHGDTEDIKKQIKMLLETISKTNIANPEAPIPEEMKEEIRGLKEGVYGIRADTADIKELKKSVHDIHGDTEDTKKQIKVLLETISKTNIANTEAPIPGGKVIDISLFDGSKQPNHSISKQNHERNLSQPPCRRTQRSLSAENAGFSLGGRVIDFSLFDGSKQPNHSISKQNHEQNLSQPPCRSTQRSLSAKNEDFSLGGRVIDFSLFDGSKQPNHSISKQNHEQNLSQPPCRSTQRSLSAKNEDFSLGGRVIDFSLFDGSKQPNHSISKQNHEQNLSQPPCRSTQRSLSAKNEDFSLGGKVIDISLFDGSKQPNHSISKQNHEQNLSQPPCRSTQRSLSAKNEGFSLGGKVIDLSLFDGAKQPNHPISNQNHKGNSPEPPCRSKQRSQF